MGGIIDKSTQLQQNPHVAPLKKAPSKKDIMC